LKIYELNNEKLSKTIINLNAQQEEASRLSGMLNYQLSKKEAYYERLQTKVVSLRHGLEKSNKELSQYQKLEGSTKALDEMILKQRSSLIKCWDGVPWVSFGVKITQVLIQFCN